MVFCLIVLFWLILLLSTFLYFVGFSSTRLISQPFLYKERHYFYATVYFVEFGHLSLLKGLEAKTSQACSGAVLVGLALRLERGPQRLLLEPLWGQGVLPGARRGDPRLQEGPLLPPQSPLCGPAAVRIWQNTLWQGSVGKEFAPGSQSGEEKGRFGAEEDGFGARVCSFVKLHVNMLYYRCVRLSFQLHWCHKFPGISWLLRKSPFLY